MKYLEADPILENPLSVMGISLAPLSGTYRLALAQAKRRKNNAVDAIFSRRSDSGDWDEAPIGRPVV